MSKRFKSFHDQYDEWQVLDSEDNDRIVAICNNGDDANHVANAMNFNHKPGDYDYKLVTGE